MADAWYCRQQLLNTSQSLTHSLRALPGQRAAGPKVPKLWWHASLLLNAFLSLAKWPPGATWLSHRLAFFQWFCPFRSLLEEREAWTIFSGLIWQEQYKLLILFDENYNMAPDNVAGPLNTDPIIYL